MQILSNRFTWMPSEGHFTTFASDAQFRLERIYQDACDVGFVMVSERTGKELTFYLDKEERDPSGEDIIAWHFKSDSRDPLLKKLTATVWND